MSKDPQHEPTAKPVDHWRLAEQAAALLLPAWNDPSRALASLPEELRPRDEGWAYAIQQAVMRDLGRIGGWKVGATGPGEDAAFFCAPMPLANIHQGPGRFSGPAWTLRGVEAEIAVRLNRDLERRETPYTRAEILEAIDSCHPAIEVLQSRFQDPDAQDRLTTLADFNAHGGFVYGPPIAGWRDRDFAHEGVRVLVDGREEVRRTGNPAGEMIRMVQWLANVGTLWAGGLRVGQFVTTGSWTGKTLVGPDAKVQVAFATAGGVDLSFSGAGARAGAGA